MGRPATLCALPERGRELGWGVPGMQIKSAAPPDLPLQAGEERKDGPCGSAKENNRQRCRKGSAQRWMSAVCAPHHPAVCKLQGMGDLRAGLR